MKQACCEFLESQLDPSNCLGIRDFAETHNCVDLMQAAEVFSQKHFPEVVQHEEFILLNQEEVEKLIKCDEIQVKPEKYHTVQSIETCPGLSHSSCFEIPFPRSFLLIFLAM